MERKIFMTICIIGAVLASTSMAFTTIAKQYTGSIFYLILFLSTYLDFIPRRMKQDLVKQQYLKSILMMLIACSRYRDAA